MGDPDQAMLWHERDLEVNPILAMQTDEEIMMKIKDLRACKSFQSLMKLKCNLNDKVDPCCPQSIRSEPYDEKCFLNMLKETLKRPRKCSMLCVFSTKHLTNSAKKICQA